MRRCQKCKGIENIHEHHLIPKRYGGKDSDGRILLCEKCHNTLHKIIVKKIRNDIEDFTLWWVSN